jgi:hypothetical protein
MLCSRHKIVKLGPGAIGFFPNDAVQGCLSDIDGSHRQAQLSTTVVDASAKTNRIDEDFGGLQQRSECELAGWFNLGHAGLERSVDLSLYTYRQKEEAPYSARTGASKNGGSAA